MSLLINITAHRGEVTSTLSLLHWGDSLSLKSMLHTGTSTLCQHTELARSKPEPEAVWLWLVWCCVCSNKCSAGAGWLMSLSWAQAEQNYLRAKDLVDIPSGRETETPLDLSGCCNWCWTPVSQCWNSLTMQLRGGTQWELLPYAVSWHKLPSHKLQRKAYGSLATQLSTHSFCPRHHISSLPGQKMGCWRLAGDPLTRPRFSFLWKKMHGAQWVIREPMPCERLRSILHSSTGIWHCLWQNKGPCTSHWRGMSTGSSMAQAHNSGMFAIRVFLSRCLRLSLEPGC